jgi:hypothetical protein
MGKIISYRGFDPMGGSEKHVAADASSAAKAYQTSEATPLGHISGQF